MSAPDASVRLRQAVLAAGELDAVAGALRDTLGLGEPFADPGVEYFGLRNAVFAIGDTFLEVVSPVRPDTAAGRLLERRGGDCGYMLMFQVDDLAGARARAGALGMREVFEVALDDIAEVHLHPADIRGAIVSLSTPVPPDSWRWGGPDWSTRAAPGSIAGAVLAVRNATDVQARWTEVLGAPPPGIDFVEDPNDRGLIEIKISGHANRPSSSVGGVRLTPEA